MLSESGTLGDYGNPKLITAGLVQQEIRDILDTATAQEHQGCLCLLGREGWRGANNDPFPLRSWLGRKEMRMNKGRWKARKHCSLWACGVRVNTSPGSKRPPAVTKSPSRAAPQGQGSVTNSTAKPRNRCPQSWPCCCAGPGG